MYKLLLVAIAILFLLMTAVHGFMAYLGVRAIVRRDFISGEFARTSLITRQNAIGAGLAYVGFGCILGGAWLGLLVWAVRQLIKLSLGLSP
jgi:hypothetical protein